MIEHLEHWRFEAREAQREAWDAAREAKEPDAFAEFIEALDQLELANEGKSREDAPV